MLCMQIGLSAAPVLHLAVRSYKPNRGENELAEPLAQLETLGSCSTYG